MLKRIEWSPPPGEPPSYPFTLPALAGLDGVDVAPVTLLAGENGSGKSTFLEALAVCARLPTLGSAPAHRDPSLEVARRFADRMRLVWRRRTHRGFFLRAEDVFGFILGLREARTELETELRAAKERLEGASDYALRLGLGPYRASLADLERRYGADPDARSHGETFLHLFRERIVPGGLHLMDEPEAALSPQSQLAFLALVADGVAAGAQFVIATHSPLLLAVPGALLLSFDERPLAPVAWDDLGSVRMWRDLLRAPEAYLRHLWPGASPEG